MLSEIKTINLPLPLRLGSVNCYLIEAEHGFVLIDTGVSNMRAALTGALESAGCRPGNLNLIVITHGDFDHTGNAAYLRRQFGSKIAMHRDDLGMAEKGDMLFNRKSSGVVNRMVAFLTPKLMGYRSEECFTPDRYLKHGDRLSDDGLDAEILSIPGHSRGSIGALSDSGDFFCGDLFDNRGKPGLSSIMDDFSTAQTSFEKLKGYAIDMVYPGHGKPFPMNALKEMH